MVGLARLRRKTVEDALTYLGIAFFIFVALFPVAWMVATSLKDDSDLIDPKVIPFWFSRPPSFHHFEYLFTETHYVTWLINTFIISASVVAITLTVCIPAAYALSRMRFFGSDNLAIAIFVSYIVPPTILFLPLAQIVANLGIYSTKWALILVYPTFTIPFCLWLLRGFFKTVPIEIEEAALVDGCNRWQAVRRVVLPLTVAGIMTVAIFAFTLGMQEFVYAFTMVTASTQKPVTLGVPTELIRGDVYFFGSLMAGALLAGAPVAVLYNFFLDYFVEGITGGAIR
jgi:multiple sugar transport system permease protein